MKQLPTTAPPPRRRKIFDASFLILASLALVAGGALWWRDGGGAVWSVLVGNLGFLVLLLPKILAGLFVANAIPLLIPREHVVAALGRESGWRGLVLATLAGALVPGGGVMVFAMATSLTAAGAHLAPIVAFVTSWSLLGLNRTIIWEISFLSLDLVAFRYALCLPMPFLAGLLVKALRLP